MHVAGSRFGTGVTASCPFFLKAQQTLREQAMDVEH